MASLMLQKLPIFLIVATEELFKQYLLKQNAFPSPVNYNICKKFKN